MMNKTTFKGLATALLLPIIIFTSCKDNDRELEEANRRLDSISEVLTQQKKKSDSLQQLVEKGKMAEDYPIYFGREFEDIEDPEEFITGSLRENPEKIPLEPVLGGTMEFRNIKVLTKDWVLAQYDDGHIQGSSIYEYSLGNNGELHFEIVASQQPE